MNLYATGRKLLSVSLAAFVAFQSSFGTSIQILANDNDNLPVQDDSNDESVNAVETTAKEAVNEEETSGTEEDSAVEEIEPETEEPISADFDEENGVLTLSASQDISVISTEDSYLWTPYLGEIQKIIFSEGITDIGTVLEEGQEETGLFEGLSSLKEIQLPESLEVIGDKAFKGTALKEVQIPASVKEIGQEAFADLTVEENENNIVLVQVDGIYADLKLSDDAFKQIDAEVYIAQKNKFGGLEFKTGDHVWFTLNGRKGVFAGEGAIYNKSEMMKTIVSILSEKQFAVDRMDTVVFEDGISEISDFLFSNIELNIETVSIGKSVTRIGTNAFENCKSIKTVTIAENSELKEVAEFAFKDLENLSSINLPEGTEVANNVFDGCVSLQQEINEEEKGEAEEPVKEEVKEEEKKDVEEVEQEPDDKKESTEIQEPEPIRKNNALYSNNALTNQAESNGGISLFAATPNLENCRELREIYYDSIVQVSNVSKRSSIYFRFEAPVYGTYTFRSSNKNGDPYVYVYNSAGSQINYNDDGAGNLEFTVSQTLNQGEVIYVRACAYGDYTASYTINVTSNISLIESPDISLQDIYWNQPKSVSNVSVSNSTYFRFQAPFEAKYTFKSYSNSGDPYSVLYNKNGEQVDYNDDGGDGNNFLIKRTLTKGEIVYLRARAYSGGVASYTVSVTTDGDYFELAGVEIRDIQLNQPEQVENVTGESSLYFRFRVPSSGTYIFKSLYENGDPYAELYSNDGTQLNSNDSSGDYDNFQIVQSLTSGQTVYLRASAFGMGSASYTAVVETQKSETTVTTSSSQYISVESTSSSHNSIANAENIYCYQARSVTNASYNNSVYFRFEAPVSATYTFESFNRSGDPYGYLYSSSGSSLTYNDDGGTDSRNFRMTRSMTKGEVVYLKAAAYSSGSASYRIIVSSNYSGICGDHLVWFFDKDEGVLLIQGTGEMYNYEENRHPGWYQWKSEITSVQISEECTSIGNYAFFNLNNVETLNLPDKIERIGDYALSGIKTLENLVLPDSVTQVGSYVVYGDSSLTSLQLSENISSFGMYAFAYAPNLGNVNGHSIYSDIEAEYQNTNINRECFFRTLITDSDTLSWPAGNNAVAELKEGVLTFSGSGNLWGYESDTKIPWYKYFDIIHSVTVENEITAINIEGKSCSPLSGISNSVEINFEEESQLETIGNNAFKNISGINSITLPASVKTIGQNAFANCTSLTSIEFDAPGNIEAVGRECFAQSMNLESINGQTEYLEVAELFNEDALSEPMIFENTKIMPLPRFGKFRNINLEVPETVNEATNEKRTYFIFTAPETGTYFFYGSECSITANGYIYSSDYILRTSSNSTSWKYNFKMSWNMEEGEKIYFGTCPDSVASTPYTVQVVKMNGGQCGDDLYWSVSGNTLTITGSGDMWNFYEGLIPGWENFQSDITTIVLSEECTSIGNNAFKDFTSLRTVQNSVGLETIGNNAFYNTNSLTKFQFGDALKEIGKLAFYNTNLTSIVLPESLQILAPAAFYNSRNLSSVNGESDLHEIRGLFQNLDIHDSCFSFTQITNRSDLWIAGPDAYAKLENGTLVIFGTGDVVGYSGHYTQIPWYGQSSNISKIEIQEGITSINADNEAYSPFYNLTTCTEILLPESLETIGNSTFKGMNFETVEFPSSLKSIGDEAFKNCESLKNIEFRNPETLENMGTSAFEGCYILSKVNGINGIEQVNNLFTNVSFTRDYEGEYSVWLWTALNVWTVQVGDNAFATFDSGKLTITGTGEMWQERMPWYPFAGSSDTVSFRWRNYNFRKALKELVIEEGITSVGSQMYTRSSTVNQAMYYGFYQADNLENISLPSTLKTIGAYAFYKTSLHNIVIPASVENIGYAAFSSRTNHNLTGSEDTSDVIEEHLLFENPENIKRIGDYAFAYNNEQSGINLVSVNAKTVVIRALQLFPNAQLGWMIFERTGLKAASESRCGNSAYYELNEGTLEIYGTGEVWTDVNWSIDPLEVHNIVIDEGIAGIGSLNQISSAFGSRDSLSSGGSVWKNVETISLPDSLEYIGKYAFDGLIGLKTITIPENVTSIGEGAFTSCPYLETVTFENPEGLTTLGSGAFQYCYFLYKINRADDIEEVNELFPNASFTGTNESNGMWYQTALNRWTVQVGDNAWAEFDGQKIKVTGSGPMWDRPMPWTEEECRDTGDMAPWYNLQYSVRSVEIGEGITSVGIKNAEENGRSDDYAARCGFANGYRIKSVSLPYTLLSVGDCAFQNTGVRNVTIPANVTYVGAHAFSNRGFYYLDDSSDFEDSMTLTAPQKIQTVGDGAFANADGETRENPFGRRYLLNSINGQSAVLECNKLLKQAQRGAGLYENTGIIDTGEIQCGDDAYYALNEDGTLTIFGTGTVWGGDNTWLPNKNLVTKVVVEEGITGLGDFGKIDESVFDLVEHPLFSGCENLTEVILPESLEYIGSGAFAGCTSLTTVDMQEGIKQIGNYAFYGCSLLEDCVLPETVESLGAASFAESAFNAGQLPQSLITIGNYAFYKNNLSETVTIPETVTMIGASAFEFTTGVQTIDFSNANVIVNDAAFRYSSVQSLQNTENIKSIGSYAFTGCTDLSSPLSFGENLEVIHSYAFENCANIPAVSFENFNGTIEANAFDGTKNIEELEFVHSDCTIESRAFANSGVSSVKFTDSAPVLGGYLFINSPLESVVFENSAAQIGENTFTQSSNLKTVDLGDKVVSIGSYAFQSCSLLTEMAIPGSVTSIGSYVFRNDEGLVEITFANPENVQYLGNHAFADAVNLERINDCTTEETVNAKFTHPDLTMGARLYENTKITSSVLEDVEGIYTLEWVDSSNKVESSAEKVVDFRAGANTVKYRLTFALSGNYLAKPGTIEIRLPAHLFIDANGQAVDTFDIGVAENQQGEISFKYSIDDQGTLDTADDEIVLSNWQNVSSAFSFVTEIVYSYDDNRIDGGYSKSFLADFIFPTESGGYGSAHSNTLTVEQQSSDLSLKQITKSKVELYKEWNSSWGENPYVNTEVEPDSIHRTFVIWRIDALLNAGNADFSLKFKELINNPDIEVLGFSRERDGQFVRSEETENDDNEDPLSYVWNVEHPLGKYSYRVYVLIAYPADSFNIGKTLENQAQVILKNSENVETTENVTGGFTLSDIETPELVGNLFYQWDDSWGPAPDDADQYVYFWWTAAAKAASGAVMPDLVFTATASEGSSIVGALPGGEPGALEYLPSDGADSLSVVPGSQEDEGAIRLTYLTKMPVSSLLHDSNTNVSSTISIGYNEDSENNKQRTYQLTVPSVVTSGRLNGTVYNEWQSNWGAGPAGQDDVYILWTFSADNCTELPLWIQDNSNGLLKYRFEKDGKFENIPSNGLEFYVPAGVSEDGSENKTNTVEIIQKVSRASLNLNGTTYFTHSLNYGYGPEHSAQLNPTVSRDYSIGQIQKIPGTLYSEWTSDLERKYGSKPADTGESFFLEWDITINSINGSLPFYLYDTPEHGKVIGITTDGDGRSWIDENNRAVYRCSNTSYSHRVTVLTQHPVDDIAYGNRKELRNNVTVGYTNNPQDTVKTAVGTKTIVGTIDNLTKTGTLHTAWNERWGSYEELTGEAAEEAEKYVYILWTIKAETSLNLPVVFTDEIENLVAGNTADTLSGLNTTLDILPSENKIVIPARGRQSGDNGMRYASVVTRYPISQLSSGTAPTIVNTVGAGYTDRQMIRNATGSFTINPALSSLRKTGQVYENWNSAWGDPGVDNPEDYYYTAWTLTAYSRIDLPVYFKDSESGITGSESSEIVGGTFANSAEELNKELDVFPENGEITIQTRPGGAFNGAHYALVVARHSKTEFKNRESTNITNRASAGYETEDSYIYQYASVSLNSMISGTQDIIPGTMFTSWNANWSDQAPEDEDCQYAVFAYGLTTQTESPVSIHVNQNDGNGVIVGGYVTDSLNFNGQISDYAQSDGSLTLESSGPGRRYAIVIRKVPKEEFSLMNPTLLENTAHIGYDYADDEKWDVIQSVHKDKLIESNDRNYQQFNKWQAEWGEAPENDGSDVYYVAWTWQTNFFSADDVVPMEYTNIPSEISHGRTILIRNLNGDSAQNDVRDGEVIQINGADGKTQRLLIVVQYPMSSLTSANTNVSNEIRMNKLSESDDPDREQYEYQTFCRIEAGYQKVEKTGALLANWNPSWGEAPEVFNPEDHFLVWWNVKTRWDNFEEVFNPGVVYTDSVPEYSYILGGKDGKPGQPDPNVEITDDGHSIKIYGTENSLEKVEDKEGWHYEQTVSILTMYPRTMLNAENPTKISNTVNVAVSDGATPVQFVGEVEVPVLGSKTGSVSFQWFDNWGPTPEEFYNYVYVWWHLNADNAGDIDVTWHETVTSGTLMGYREGSEPGAYTPVNGNSFSVDSKHVMVLTRYWRTDVLGQELVNTAQLQMGEFTQKVVGKVKVQNNAFKKTPFDQIYTSWQPEWSETIPTRFDDGKQYNYIWWVIDATFTDWFREYWVRYTDYARDGGQIIGAQWVGLNLNDQQKKAWRPGAIDYWSSDGSRIQFNTYEHRRMDAKASTETVAILVRYAPEKLFSDITNVCNCRRQWPDGTIPLIDEFDVDGRRPGSGEQYKPQPVISKKFEGIEHTWNSEWLNEPGFETNDYFYTWWSLNAKWPSDAEPTVIKYVDVPDEPAEIVGYRSGSEPGLVDQFPQKPRELTINGDGSFEEHYMILVKYPKSMYQNRYQLTLKNTAKVYRAGANEAILTAQHSYPVSTSDYKYAYTSTKVWNRSWENPEIGFTEPALPGTETGGSGGETGESGSGTGESGSGTGESGSGTGESGSGTGGSGGETVKTGNYYYLWWKIHADWSKNPELTVSEIVDDIGGEVEILGGRYGSGPGKIEVLPNGTRLVMPVRTNELKTDVMILTRVFSKSSSLESFVENSAEIVYTNYKTETVEDSYTYRQYVPTVKKTASSVYEYWYNDWNTGYQTAEEMVGGQTKDYFYIWWSIEMSQDGADQYVIPKVTEDENYTLRYAVYNEDGTRATDENGNTIYEDRKMVDGQIVGARLGTEEGPIVFKPANGKLEFDAEADRYSNAMILMKYKRSDYQTEDSMIIENLTLKNYVRAKFDNVSYSDTGTYIYNPQKPVLSKSESTKYELWNEEWVDNAHRQLGTDSTQFFYKWWIINADQRHLKEKAPVTLTETDANSGGIVVGARIGEEPGELTHYANNGELTMRLDPAAETNVAVLVKYSRDLYEDESAVELKNTVEGDFDIYGELSADARFTYTVPQPILTKEFVQKFEIWNTDWTGSTRDSSEENFYVWWKVEADQSNLKTDDGEPEFVTVMLTENPQSLSEGTVVGGRIGDTPGLLDELAETGKPFTMELPAAENTSVMILVEYSRSLIQNSSAALTNKVTASFVPYQPQEADAEYNYSSPVPEVSKSAGKIYDMVPDYSTNPVTYTNEHDDYFRIGWNITVKANTRERVPFALTDTIYDSNAEIEKMYSVADGQRTELHPTNGVVNSVTNEEGIAEIVVYTKHRNADYPLNQVTNIRNSVHVNFFSLGEDADSDETELNRRGSLTKEHIAFAEDAEALYLRNIRAAVPGSAVWDQIEEMNDPDYFYGVWEVSTSFSGTSAKQVSVVNGVETVNASGMSLGTLKLVEDPGENGIPVMAQVSNNPNFYSYEIGVFNEDGTLNLSDFNASFDQACYARIFVKYPRSMYEGKNSMTLQNNARLETSRFGDEFFDDAEGTYLVPDYPADSLELSKEPVQRDNVNLTVLQNAGSNETDEFLYKVDYQTVSANGSQYEMVDDGLSIDGFSEDGSLKAGEDFVFVSISCMETEQVSYQIVNGTNGSRGEIASTNIPSSRQDLMYLYIEDLEGNEQQLGYWKGTSFYDLEDHKVYKVQLPVNARKVIVRSENTYNKHRASFQIGVKVLHSQAIDRFVKRQTADNIYVGNHVSMNVQHTPKNEGDERKEHNLDKSALYEFGSLKVQDYSRKEFSESQTVKEQTLVRLPVTLNFYEDGREEPDWADQLNHFAEGTVYDLLPVDTSVDPDSFVITGHGVNRNTGIEETYSVDNVQYDVTYEANWQGSGRTMMKIHVTGDQNRIRRYSYGWQIQYTMIATYSRLSDRGGDFDNYAAWMSEQGKLLGTEAVGDTYPNPAEDDENDPWQYFRDLNNNGEADPNTTIYCNASTTVSIPTTGEGNFVKWVAADGGSFGTNAVVESEGGYTYRLRYESMLGSSRDVIFYDVLEDAFEEDSVYWQGKLDYIDVSYALSRGIQPKIYYSTAENLEPVTASEVTEDGDLSDDVIWNLMTYSQDDNGIIRMTELTDSRITAVAFDFSKTVDGNNFVLNKQKGLFADIHMLALPSESKMSEMVLSPGFTAYNQASYSLTMMDEDAGAAQTFKGRANDRESFATSSITEVEYILTQKYHVEKVWNDPTPVNHFADTVTIRLAEKTDEAADFEVTEKYVNLNGSNEYQGTFDRLRAFDDEGNRIYYDVIEDEENMLEGYFLEKVETSDYDQEDRSWTTVFTNKKTIPLDYDIQLPAAGDLGYTILFAAGSGLGATATLLEVLKARRKKKEFSSKESEEDEL